MLRFYCTLGMIAGLAISLQLTGACQEADSAPKYSKSLIVLPAAYKVSYRFVDGATQLTYKLDATYPAEGELGTISENLQRQRWKPLKYDFLNPSIPSSHLRGWQQFEDHTTHPYETVRQWLAWWVNPSHDVVSYALEYRYPANGDVDLHTLRVFASFMPAQIAEKTKKSVTK